MSWKKEMRHIKLCWCAFKKSEVKLEEDRCFILFNLAALIGRLWLLHQTFTAEWI